MTMLCNYYYDCAAWIGLGLDVCAEIAIYAQR